MVEPSPFKARNNRVERRRQVSKTSPSLQVVALLYGTLGSLFTTVVHAQPEVVEGRLIAEIRIDGAEGLEIERIIGRLGLRVGEKLEHARLTRGIRDILDWPSIAGARISEIQLRDDGQVTVEVKVKTLPRLDGFVFVGAKVVSREKLANSLALDLGAHLGKLDLEEAQQRLVKTLRDEGFLYGDVEFELRQLPAAPLNAMLVVTIREGLRATVSAIHMRGNEAFSDWHLRATMRNRPRILFGLISKGHYQPDLLDEDLEKIRQLYRDRGYLDVVVQAGKFELSKTTREIELSVFIEEGARFRNGKIVVEGHQKTLETPLTERIHSKTGEFYDAASLERDRRRLLNYYQKNLYRSPQIKLEHRYRLTSMPENTDANDEIVDLVFKVDERRHFFAGRINIQGNRLTRNRVLRNRLEIEPLGPLTNPLLQDSVDALRGLLRHFETVGVNTTPSGEEQILSEQSGNELGAQNVEDVTVEVEENDDGLFFLSGGAESGKGAVATIGVEKTNFDLFDWPGGKRGWERPFTGGGQYLRLELLPGTRKSQFNAVFREPYFFNSRHAFSASALNDTFDWREFDETHMGADVGVRTYWNRARSLSSRLAWVVDDVEIDDLERDADLIFRELKGHTFHSYPSLRLTFSDVRVNRYSGPRGFRLETRVDLALDETGSETEFIRSLTSIDHHLAMSDWLNLFLSDSPLNTEMPSMEHILHFGGRFGWMEGLGSDDVPFFENFFLGGPRSFRGFDYRGVGSHVNDVPIGGETFWNGTVSYSFPLFIPEIRLQGIFDFGDVQSSPSDYSIDTLRTAAGGGLSFRFDLLGGVPVNLYFVEALKKESGDEDRMFTFSIGSNF